MIAGKFIVSLDLKETLDYLLSQNYILKNSENYLVKELNLITDRLDLVDYCVNRLKQKRSLFKIYLLDSSRVLEGLYEEGQVNYFSIPIGKWKNEFYKNYLKLKSLESSSSGDLIMIEECIKEEVPEKLKEKEVAKKLKQGWIKETNIPGCFFYQPNYVKLEKILTSLYEQVLFDNKAPQNKFSSLISVPDLIQSDYLYSCCPQLHYHLKLTGDLTNLRKRSMLEGHIDPMEFLNHTTGVHYALNYCSCHGIWSAFKNYNFNQKDIVKFYDNSVYTYRDQKGTLNSLERLELFNRFETVYLASEELAKLEFSSLYEKLKQFFDYCNLSYTVVKGPAWYTEKQDEGRYTYDFNYLGEKRTIEMGNLSYNGTHWTNAHNVSYNNKLAYSGCSGVGIQRLIYVFLITNGFNPLKWPKKVVQIMDKLRIVFDKE